MLRPATPLTVALLLAFVFLILTVLSTPVIKAIPLGSDQDYNFGVFGYCSADDCSPIRLGYGNVDDIPPGDGNGFNFSPGIRKTLSSILILHAVGALLTLVTMLMAIAAHVHSLSHSSRYLLLLFILLLIDFLVCIAAFVVDLLLFLPHQAWGTYIVLAAAILVLISAAATCGVRRHMVRRKAFNRKAKRNSTIGVADDYYNIQNIAQKPSFVNSSQPTMPMISGANGSPDVLPAFATFEPDSKRDGRMSDEQIPLTLRPTRSERSVSSAYRTNDEMHPAGGVGMALSGPTTRSNTLDPYGAYAHGHADPYGPGPGPGRGMPHARGPHRGGRRSTDPPGSYRGHNVGHHQQMLRGRGAYGPRGGPNYGPRGGGGGGGGGYGGPGNVGRGNWYGPPSRGAYEPSGVMRTEGRTPPLTHIPMADPLDSRIPEGQQSPYRNNSPLPLPPSAAAAAAAAAATQRAAQNASPATGKVYTPYSPNADRPRAESTPPLAGSMSELSPSETVVNPIELDATPASTSGTSSPVNPLGSGHHTGSIPEVPEPYVTAETSRPETQYISAREAWNASPRVTAPRMGSPPAATQDGPGFHAPERNLTASPVQVQNGGYYEDVDPRFDQAHNDQMMQQQAQAQAHAQAQQAADGDDLFRERSPAESVHSNFTSISQRGVNPQWNPQPPMPQGPGPYGPRHQQHHSQQQQQRHDMILDNADFRVPGDRGGGPGPGGAGGMTPGSAYPQGPL